MSAAERIADPRALLDAMQARCDAATDGPWSATHGLGEVPRIWSDAPQYEAAEFIAKCAMKEDVPDAEFIAAARTDLPRLIAVVRAVLEVHAHSEDYPQECRDGCGWPCPTVTTLTAALKEADDD